MVRTKTQLQRLIRGAMGEIKADLIVTGDRLINVYSGEILDGMEIAVIDGRICYVGPSAQHARGEATEILDARGTNIELPRSAVLAQRSHDQRSCPGDWVAWNS